MAATEELAVLQRVGQRIAGELELDTLIGRLVEEAKLTCHAEYGGFVPQAAIGESPVRVDDITLDARYARNPPDLGSAEAHPPIRSYLAAPVRSMRSLEVFGALSLGHRDPGAFTLAHERALATIAMIAGLSIEHARLYEKAKRTEREYARRARQARLAADVAGAIARGTGLRPILQRCAEAVVRNLDVAFARVWTLDPDGRELQLQASAGMYTHLDGAHARVPVGMLKIGRIAARNEPHFTNAVTVDPWISDRSWAVQEGLTAFAGYPLTYQGRVMGVLALFSRKALADDTVDALGAISDTIALAIDRARADEELRKSEVRHRLVVESSQDGIWFTDFRRNVTDANDRLLDMLGMRRDDWKGEFSAFLERIHPEDRDRMKRALDAHLEVGVPFYVEEFRLRDAVGEYRFCTTKGRAESDALGKPLRMAASVTDITERRRAELALLAERARFFNLLMDAPAAIAFLEGNEHRFAFANRQYTALVQRPILGMTAANVFPDDERLQSDLAQVHRTGEALVGREVSVNVEHEGVSRCAYFDYVYEPVRDPDGQLAGVLIHAVDVTQKVDARRQIEQANNELEQRIAERTAALVETNRELEAFSYTVSHDLRAPIRHIAGFLDLLKSHAASSLDAKSLRYVDTIGGAAKQMGLLIDGLLAFSRMGRTAIAKRRLDGDVLLREILDELHPDLRGRDVELKVGTIGALYGDPTMLRAVLSNLVANAVKYTAPRAKATIEIGRAPDRDGQTVVVVKDNGVGFDMAHANKLFGVFQRLHGPEEFEGTGIGLATVRRIVQRHGGRVWAEGEPDVGATFSFSLPPEPEERA